jgi:hypothetical protein
MRKEARNFSCSSSRVRNSSIDSWVRTGAATLSCSARAMGIAIVCSREPIPTERLAIPESRSDNGRDDLVGCRCKPDDRCLRHRAKNVTESNPTSPGRLRICKVRRGKDEECQGFCRLRSRACHTGAQEGPVSPLWIPRRGVSGAKGVKKAARWLHEPETGRSYRNTRLGVGK